MVLAEELSKETKDRLQAKQSLNYPQGKGSMESNLSLIELDHVLLR